ncbi:MAG: peptidoglycan hydrolase-like protein with peptidoglycan-binding domain [Myxococcota bacterium]|jgi:peptidoglycan hydrolase-like protein with peptidoglycan-binding domain
MNLDKRECCDLLWSPTPFGAFSGDRMSAMSFRRRAEPSSTAKAGNEKAEDGPAASNAQLAESLESTETSSGPFESSILNSALAAAFGSSLDGLSATKDPARNSALGARAVTEGSNMSFGQGVDENMADLDFIETAAHETAHALAGGGSGKTELDADGDPGEAQADSAGKAFRSWAQTGFEGAAPSLQPANAGEANMHRDHTVGGWSGSPVLRQGTNGRQVRSLQTLLNAHGMRIGVDGSFGPRTRQALMAFQLAVGLLADGIAGAATAGKLNRAATVRPVARPDTLSGPAPVTQVTGDPVLSFNSRGGIVSALQALLNAKGASETVDGVFGAGTRRAVVAFQRANGLSPDGVVGTGTAAKLNDPSSKDIAAADLTVRAGQGESFAGNEAYADIREAVMAAAESHMGAPYSWGADGPGMFDCSGFVLYVLRQNTGLIQWGDDTAAGISNRVPATNSPQRGDLVFYRGRNGITHIEFATGQGSQTVGASGGGSRTHGDDPGAKVQYGNWTRDRRAKSFGSLDRLIQQYQANS